MINTKSTGLANHTAPFLACDYSHDAVMIFCSVTLSDSVGYDKKNPKGIADCSYALNMLKNFSDIASNCWKICNRKKLMV